MSTDPGRGQSPRSVMIVDPRTLLIVMSFPLRQPRIRLFPKSGPRGLWRPLFHWVVQLGMISDRYVLTWKYLTMILHRGGGGVWAPADETDVCCVRLDDFDWVVPDRVPDMLVSGCATEEFLSVDLMPEDHVVELPSEGHVDAASTAMPPGSARMSPCSPPMVSLDQSVVSSMVLSPNRVCLDTSPDLPDAEPVFEVSPDTASAGLGVLL